MRRGNWYGNRLNRPIPDNTGGCSVDCTWQSDVQDRFTFVETVFGLQLFVRGHATRFGRLRMASFILTSIYDKSKDGQFHPDEYL